MRFSELLKAFRKENNLTERELGILVYKAKYYGEINTAHGHISRYENSPALPAKKNTLKIFSEALGIKLEDLKALIKTEREQIGREKREKINKIPTDGELCPNCGHDSVFKRYEITMRYNDNCIYIKQNPLDKLIDSSNFLGF